MQTCGHPVPGVAQAGCADKRKDEFNTRKRQRPKKKVDLRTQAPAADERQAFAAFWKLVSQLHHHTAAERLSNESGALVAENVHDVTEDIGVGAQGILAAPGLTRFA